jgi:uncharacterized membrane protein YsdA (DUF1294 family)
MASANPLENLGNIVAGVIFWIGAWQLAQLFTEHLPKKKKIQVYFVLTVLSLIVLAIIYANRRRRVEPNVPLDGA